MSGDGFHRTTGKAGWVQWLTIVGKAEGTTNCWGNDHGMLNTNQLILIKMIIDDDNDN